MQVQIDCNLMKAETLEYIFYDGQMGEGRPTFLTHDKIEWKYYPPGSSMHIVIKAICSL